MELGEKNPLPLSPRLATSMCWPKSILLNEIYGRLNLHMVRANTTAIFSSTIELNFVFNKCCYCHLCNNNFNDLFFFFLIIHEIHLLLLNIDYMYNEIKPLSSVQHTKKTHNTQIITI